MNECQEPRCNQPASKVWGGRKVCSDHFETYQEQQDRNIAEMRDF